MAKILFILPTFSAGGAENYVLRFLKHYYKDFDFHILSVSQKQGDLHEEFKALGIPMFYQSIGYFDFKKIKYFYTFLKKEEYDTIVSFTGNFSGLPLTIAKYAGVKNRIAFYRRSSNAFGQNKLKLFYNNFVNGLVKKSATFILSNSETAFKNFHAEVYQNNPKYRIIKNGVSAKDFAIEVSKEEAKCKLNLNENTFLIGHVGRFDPAKNHDTIFKVIALLKSQCADFKFMFCGKGTDSDEFIDQLKIYDIQDVVSSLGLRNDLPLIYRSLDVFYFPSITEGQPNALIEAMISGLPVVTSNIPPILEALPKEAGDLTLIPTDVSTATGILERFIQRDIDVSLYSHQNWAIENFDLETNFNEFKQLL